MRRQRFIISLEAAERSKGSIPVQRIAGTAVEIPGSTVRSDRIWGLSEI